MVDGAGRVVTTIFAATTSGPRGGYGVPNAIVRDALASAGGRGRHWTVRRLSYPAATVGKTLVIAEKPSVGRDLTRVAARARSRSTRAISSPIRTSSRGRSAISSSSRSRTSTTPKFKKWRMADLPIVPDEFKLVVRDERSRKQFNVISKQLRRDDVDVVINACDAGREGELIFAWTYEKAEAPRSPSSGCGCRR